MDKVEAAHAILDQAVREYEPTHAFALFSGGYDSLTTTHVSMGYLFSKYPQIIPQVAHINTGIGVEETREFVRRVCEDQGWPLVEYHARDTARLSYRDMVLKWGFPGPAHHSLMYRWLKERSVARLMRDYLVKGLYADQRKRNRILLITGVRRQESVRRMGHVKPIQFEKGRVWTAPLMDWSKADVLDYKATHGLPNNQVVDVLHMSGECLCGAYAHEGELAMLDLFYPQTAEKIRRLECEACEAGFCWGWEEKPPQSRRKPKLKDGISGLCITCDARFEAGVH